MTQRQRDGHSVARRSGQARISEKQPVCQPRGPVDHVFCTLVLLLLAIGLIMLLSASYPSAYYEFNDPTFYFRRQAGFAAAGLILMAYLSWMDYEHLRKLAKPALLLSFLLLALVLIPGIGVVRNNARRWINLGSRLTFQPSEFAKLAVVLDFSTTIAVKKGKMATWKHGIAPYLRVLIPMALLMAAEPHLSGAVLILGVGVILMLVGGAKWRWFLAVVLVGGFGVFAMLKGWIPYGQSRIAMWQDPFIDAQGAGYQLSQSLISIGSGGLTGLGLGRSRQKHLYLPEEHNDFIFAIVCEELGLVGATIIMLLFAALILRGFWIARHAKDRFGSLLVVGMTSLVAMQTFLNIGVVTGLLPTTGISLPFFSYGGTALFVQLAETGIVLSVSREIQTSLV